MHLYNIASSGSSPMILCHVTCLWVGVLTRVQLLGDAVLLQFGGQKRLKFGAI